MRRTGIAGSTDVADPNVFFNTTIVFPNSVAAGRAQGLDARDAARAPWRLRLCQLHVRARGERGPDYRRPLPHRRVPRDWPRHRLPSPITISRTSPRPALRWQPEKAPWWLALDLRHGGGGPLEIEDDDLDEVLAGPGGDFIDADAGRMEPWTVVDIAASLDVWRGRRGQLTLRADVQNLAGARFAYTVGNPFEGTRFGHSRLLRIGAEWRSPTSCDF